MEKPLKQARKRNRLGVMGRSLDKPTVSWDELKPLKQAWKRDRLGVLGIGSAIVAFGLWAFPHSDCISEVVEFYNGGNDRFFRCTEYVVEVFSDERLLAAAAFLALAFILLLLRRR
jgi:hypothetical protein